MLRTISLACLVFAFAGPVAAQEFRHEAVPLFDNCGDPSLEKARTDGVILGISPSPPYSSIAPGGDKAEGLDVEINEAALKWAGVTKFKYEVMPFGQLIPALAHIAADGDDLSSFPGSRKTTAARSSPSAAISARAAPT